MNIADELELRSRIGAELDLLDPGPLPLDSVVRQGRTVMIRRRAIAAAAVVLVAAAALAVPKLVNIASQPASPLRYHVTVNPPGRGASKQLIATGTINKLRWIATGSINSQEYKLCWRLPADHNDSWCNGTGPPAPTFPKAPATLNGDGPGPVFVNLFVRADIRYLLVSLSNGQTVTLRPVRVFGQHHAGLVAIAVPSNRSITEVQAYSAVGEVGYAIPFTAPSDIEIVRWLQPGQPAVPKPASYTIASGHILGQSWAERLFVGPWGLCLENTWGNGSYQVSYDCLPISVDMPPLKPKPIFTQGYSQDNLSFGVIIGSGDLSYMVVRNGNGNPFLVRPYHVGASRFVVLVTTGNAGGSWIAYSVAGFPLNSSSGN
jgi:hypothetical protein